MLLTIVIPAILQATVPIALIVWLALGRPPTRAGWILRVVLVASYLVAIGLVGLWLALPWYTPVVYAGFMVLAAIRSSRRIRGDALAYHRPWGAVRGFFLALSTLLMAGAAGYAVKGLMAPARTVDLAFPMPGAGRYLVVNGGANVYINHHVRTIDPKEFPQSNGQSYGVDIVKLGPWGMRAKGALPADPRAYAIFGQTIYAPCAGDVLATWDGLSDLHPPTIDTLHPAGNAVLLRCDSIWVLLAHMKRGSVRVRPEQRVDLTTILGEAGNTGATGEPHLHIHAQRPGTHRYPLSGEPLEIRLGGAYPARNRILRSPVIPSGP
jgi:hypothetical protein